MSEHQWHHRNPWLSGGKPDGPVSEQVLVLAIDEGIVTPTCQVSCQTRTEGRWYPVQRVRQLMHVWDRGLQKRKQSRPNNLSPSVMVSHAADGQAFANGLRQWLECEAAEVSLRRNGARVVQGDGAPSGVGAVDFCIAIITPEGLASETILRQWASARQEGVRLLPVTVSQRPIDPASLPTWMSELHVFDLTSAGQRQQFITELFTG